MKVPKGSVEAASSPLSLPAVVVILVIIIGATIYLWRARYIRRATALTVILLLLLGLAIFGTWMYTHPMAAV